MEIREIIGILQKWLLMIITVTVIAGITAGLVSVFVLDEVYEATSLMMISSTKEDNDTSDITYNEYNLNIKLVNTYRELAKTERILNQVINASDLKMSSNILTKKINVTSAADTEIIKFSVQDTNPAVAQYIANTLAEVFVKEIPALVKMDNVQIIDYAALPEDPIKPNKLINIAVALILGFMLSVGIAFAIEFLDVSIKNKEQLEEIIDLPVYGVIPQMKFREKISGKLTNAMEAFIRLASNVSFLNVNSNDSVSIAISSSVMGEGKSTVLSNLCIALSQTNKKVLIIDSDMRRSMIHKLFNVSNSNGLSSLLSSNRDWKLFVKCTDYENIDIIVSGVVPPNPVMLLSTTKLKDIINDAKKTYDYIFIDTPPILVVSDTLSICSAVNHLLLVVRFKTTKEPIIRRAINDLNHISAPFAGTILNEYFSKSSVDDYYGGYGYGYYHSDTNNAEVKNIKNKLSSKRNHKRG